LKNVLAAGAAGEGAGMGWWRTVIERGSRRIAKLLDLTIAGCIPGARSERGEYRAPVRRERILK